MDLRVIFFFTVINLILFFFFKKISSFINIFDYPDSVRKFHKKKVALIGGYLILINLLLIFIINFFYEEYLISSILHQEKSIFFILASCLLFGLGTWDDKYLISANKKLFVSFGILLFFLYFNDQSVIKEIRFSFLQEKILLNNFSIIFTLFCFLLFINAFNMFDGINLQSGLYALICLIYLTFLNPNEVFYFIIIIGLLFFLFLNYKNKTFLGDGGTYLVSFIIGYSFIQNYNSFTIFYADQIFFLMLFPGLDLLRLSIVRILNNKHPFSPDRLHIHHLLLEKFKYNKTILIIFFLLLFIGILSFNLLYKYLYIIIFTFIYLYLLVFPNMKKNVLKKNIINVSKKNILFFFLILIFAHNYRFFFNVYDLLNVNYQKRLIRFHGNCGKESFGFIDQMYKKHSITTNVKITNFQDFPSSSAFFFRLENLNNDDYLIVLNKNYLELKKENKFLLNWKLIDSEDNCYLFKKK